MASSSADRRRAARLLIRVEGGAFASRLLERDGSAGVRVRVLGVLRWQRAIDHALAPRLHRPLERLDPEVRAALRLGCFEATWLGVPAAVATDAMVGLVRTLRKASAAGMVNAVLRRVSADARPREDQPPDLRWSHPEWVWRRWSDRFGGERAEGAMAAAQEPAPVWVWFPDDGDRSRLDADGVVLHRHPWCPGAWTPDEATDRLSEWIADGRAVIQDPSSQLVARLAAGSAGDGSWAIDLCAAPGGKTALLARLGGWQRLVAADVSPAKASRLSHRFGPTPVLAADAARPAVAAGKWDLVLLDAPCSGTGTFRRHPELKWRLDADAVESAAERQRPMIAAAVDLLGTGGVLVYATCSVEAEENERHFETVPDGFERAPLEDHLPTGAPWLPTAAGGVRILPHEHGDGFTIHALRRAC